MPEAISSAKLDARRMLPLNPLGLTTLRTLLLCATALAWLGCSRTKPLPMTQMIAGQTMGTTYTVKLATAANHLLLTEVTQEIEAELERVNAQMSTYLSTSEISRFNEHASRDWFPVSQETAEVVNLSLELYRRSKGAFDITVGPLVNLWGFGPSGRLEKIPSDELVAKTREFVGSDKLEVRLSPAALRKLEPQLQIDLSAIAKGHGVDRVAAMLDQLGLKAYFVEIGGEVRTKGTRPDGKLWRVGIERPDPSSRSIERVVDLQNQSMATSGNYRNFYEFKGQRYSHTIDPKTGAPKRDPILSATVVADECGLADGIATSMMSAGFEIGLELAKQHGWAVYLIESTDSGELRAVASPRFTELFP